MTKFKVILQSQPEKYYRKVDAKTAKFLNGCFKRLEINPFFELGKIRRLKGREGLFRYTIGGLRVVYEIDVENREVGVLVIFPRGDVYKKI